MALYDDLNAMHPSHNYFYTVGLSTMSEALEKCARLTADPCFVFTYNGQMIMCVQHALVDSQNGGVTWLTGISGNPEE
jgi:hypothetical protein